MSGITISGAGSGLPIDSWISQLVQIKQKDIDAISTQQSTLTSRNSALSTVKSSYSSLLSSITAITDSQFGVASDLFAKTTATSSDTNLLTVSSTSSAAKQSLSVVVSKLATSTVAQSTSATPVGAYISNDTKFSTLANGAAKSGTLSVYVDGKKFGINVAADDTVGGVLTKISDATGLWAGIRNGKIALSDSDPGANGTPTSAKNIVVGNSSDTSNFAAITALKKNGSGGYESNQAIFAVNSSAKLTSTDAGFATQVQAGSFKIGDATFTIDSTTTLSGLMSDINASDKAGASAYWDSTAGKMVLTSKGQGAYNLNIENISGNFTDVVGLTSSTYDENGAVTSSSLVANSQTLGNNATLKINGTDIISPSNTVTSDISGISGLTLTLKAVSADITKPATVTVASDSSSITSALSTFVSNFNTALSNTDQATGTDGYLYGETTLTMIRDNMRSAATSSVSSSSVYKSLADIGITTGAVGASLTDNTNQLVIDQTKLAAALKDHPDEVKKLLLGDGTNDGVFTKLSTPVNNAVKPITGFFDAKATTYTTQLTDYTDTIDKKTTELADYKTALTAKFSAMDAMIAKLKQQLANFNSALGLG